jgi:hypothetical protein
MNTGTGNVSIAALIALWAAMAWASHHAPALGPLALVAALLAAHGLWWGALARASSARRVIAVAAILQVVSLASVPWFEDDHFRYLWDGYRTLTDGTPYGPAPENWFGRDDVPAHMQPVLDGINHPEVGTIYGPLLQALFALAAALAEGDALVLRGLLSVIVLGACAAALGRSAPQEVALWAWNPLLLHETAVNCHADIIVGLLLAFAAVAARRGAALRLGAASGLVIATKLSSALAMPALAFVLLRGATGKRQRVDRLGRVVLAGAAALAVCYVPFLCVNGSELSGLWVFAAEWRFNAGPGAELAFALAPEFARTLCFIAMGALAIAAAIRVPRVDGAICLALGASLWFSPVVNSWYLLWLLPCAARTAWSWPWVAAAALSLSYLTAGSFGHEGDAYQLSPSVAALQWIVIAVAIARDLTRPAVRDVPLRAPVCCDVGLELALPGAADTIGADGKRCTRRQAIQG